MKKYHCYSASFDIETERLFRDATFLGQGNNGIVYKLPENKVIKLFIDEKVWYDESYILSRTNGSIYFPKLYEKGRLYIVREMINGIQLNKYIKENGINEEITKNIYLLTKEFERLRFTKIDTRCKDLYLCDDNKIRIIDPKKCYRREVSYPRHLMKGLLKYGVLNEFLFFMRNIDKDKAYIWEQDFYIYWDKERKKKRHHKDPKRKRK